MRQKPEMTKRQEIRARRRRQQLANRMLTIGLMAAGALLVTFAIIIPAMQRAGNANQPIAITPITPRTFNAPVDKTSIGSPDAPVKMDVWEDFQCSSCMYYSQNIEPMVLQTYVETGKVFYTYHFFLLIETFVSGGTESSHSANAAMCAAEQGRFWDYHDLLFANWNGENQGGFADQRLIAFAEALGLEMNAFNECFAENRYADQIGQDYADGQAKGVSSTPTIFVDEQMVVNSINPRYVATYEDIAAAIEAALAAK